MTAWTLPLEEIFALDDQINPQLAAIDEILTGLSFGSYDKSGPGKPDADPYDVEVSLHNDLGGFTVDARQPLAPQFADGLDAVAERLKAFAEAIRDREAKGAAKLPVAHR